MGRFLTIFDPYNDPWFCDKAWPKKGLHVEQCFAKAPMRATLDCQVILLYLPHNLSPRIHLRHPTVSDPVFGIAQAPRRAPRPRSGKPDEHGSKTVFNVFSYLRAFSALICG